MSVWTAFTTATETGPHAGSSLRAAVSALLQRSGTERSHTVKSALLGAAWRCALNKIQLMPRLLTADDIMPLVASLPDSERIKLLRQIASPRRGTDASAYLTAHPAADEFADDDEPLGWDSDGWGEFQ